MLDTFDSKNENEKYKNIYGKYSAQENIIIDEKKIFETDIPPIIDSKWQNYHYFCSKCHTFHFIRIIDEGNISYTCDKTEETISIKELFNKIDEYMTFFDGNTKSNDNIKNFNGLKCIHHKSNGNIEIKKFHYYCHTCEKNICRNCIYFHFKNNHNVFNFDFRMKEIYFKINIIIEILNKKSKKQNSENNSNFTDKLEKSIFERNNVSLHKISIEHNNNENIFNEFK